MQFHSTESKSGSRSNMRCLWEIRAEMGVNQVVPRRTPEPPSTLGSRSAHRWRVLFVNKNKYRGQSANMHQTLK